MDYVKVFIENILYPIMERKKGNRIRSNIRELQNSQGLSPEALLSLQKERLKKLLSECIAKVPAYRPFSHLKNEIEADAFHALLKFPVLSKTSFRENPDNYLNQAAAKSGLIANRTGGSTSEPVKFYLDRYTVEYYEAARWRGLSWWGITPGSRSVMIWGNPLELNQNEQWKYRLKEKWLKNRIVIPAYSLKPEAMPEYLKAINSYKPEYFYGYASALYAFSGLLLKQGLKISRKPKAVVSTSETLHDFQRKAIEEAFGCPAVNEYGARDGGILAYECTCGSMHISSENALLEIVDAKTLQPLQSGQSGLLLVTDLNNFSMPRLRYVLGDVAVLSDKICKCGLGLPILEKIEGREDDMFVTVDGQLVHGHAFNHISRALEAVEKFQIIQHSPEHAELSIIQNKNSACAADDIQQFINGVQQLLPETRIDVKLVDEIPVTGSGKFRYAIRKF